MAERVEEPDVEVEEAFDPPSAAAVAVALGRTGKGGKGLDADAQAFLRRQTRLIELQTEHLHEQRELQLSHLRVRRWRDRTGMVLQGLGALVGAAVLAAVAVMVWQAHEDHGLVVKAFSVPPDLAQRGLTGEVAASKLLDKLAGLQARTDSARASSTYQNNWGDEIKVEIPETGISVGELDRALRRWLGHETLISGDIMRTPKGLEVTARMGAEAGDSFQGSEGDLDALFEQAAEAIYQRTQPYRFGVAQIQAGHMDRGREVYETLQASGDPNEQRWATLGLANVHLFSGEVEQAEQGYEALDRRFPDFVMGVTNIQQGSATLDHEETELAAARRLPSYFPHEANPQITPLSAMVQSREGAAAEAELVGDFARGARLETQVANAPDYSGSRPAAITSAPPDLAFGHELAKAREGIASDRPPAGVLPSFLKDYDAELAQARELVDVASEDWAGAVQQGETALALDQKNRDPLSHYLIARTAAPWLAYAKARAGDAAGAEALIATTPLDGDTALRLRGRIAAAGGDWASAERWFRAATAQAPSIPFAYADWGQMLLARGDAAGAIAQLKIAHQKGPRFADALELWGEALLRQGDYAGAAGKFAEAAKLAPHWDKNNRLLLQARAKAGTHG